MARKPVGSLFGYEILLAGTEGAANRSRQWRLPNGMTLVTKDASKVLEAYLREFSLDSVSTLMSIVTTIRLTDFDNFAERLRARGLDEYINFRPVTLRQLMDASIRGRTLPDTAKASITDRALLEAEQIVHDVVPVADTRVRETDQDVLAVALRLLQFQYPDQIGYQSYYQDAAICLGIIEKAKTKGMDLDSLFGAAYGCTFADTLFMSFAILAHLAAKPGSRFNPHDFNKNGQLQGLPPETVRAFWNHCSMTYDEYKQRLDGPTVSVPDYEPYALSPLVKWPLVVQSDGNGVPPIINDLVHRACRVFHIDSLQAIEKHCPESEGVYLDALGEVYERYVGDSLMRAGHGHEVAHGSEIFGTAGKHCDWVVTEGRQVTLIEVKAISVQFDASMTKERGRLKRALGRDGSLADALIQLDESARAIRFRTTRVPKNSHLLGLIVARGDQVGLNSPFVRGLLEEILTERGRKPPIVRYQLTNDLGFSHLARAMSGGESLGRLLHKKCRDDIHRYDDMHFALEVEGQTLPGHPLADDHHQLVGWVFNRYVPGFPQPRKGESTKGSLPPPT